MANPANSAVQNLLPVQALFNLDNTFNTFIGQGQPFFATINPSQSGLNITGSTINSTTIGATTPSTGVFTNIFTTTGQVTTSPTSNSDIANKYYVDSIAQGLSPKQAVKCATTANITLSGLQTIDTYTTLSGDRVLVKNQTSSAQNGIYIASATAWTRSVDMDVWSEVPGAYTVVINGSTNANTSWVTTAADTGTIDVTAMPWVQFSGSGTYFAGTGLSLASNTFSITNTGVTAGSYGSASQTLTATVNAQGQLTSLTASNIAISASQTTSGTFSSSLLSGSYTGITGVGTLTAGTWNASTIGVAYGGTGATTFAAGYLKANGTTPFTTVASIPNSDVSGLGTMSTQNANNVAITGGTIATLTSPIGVPSGGTGASTLTGYVYGNGTGAMTASTTIPFANITGAGTMASQNANAVAITGGTINGTTIGASSASTGAFTFISTSSSTSTTPTLSFNASNSPYAAGATIANSYLQHLLQNKSATAGASTNYVLSNDSGTDSTYYGEFGMNSTVYSASTPADFFSINNGIYLSGHDGDLTFGSGNGYKSYFAWGTTGQSAHVINVTGALGFSTNLGTTPALSGTTGFGTSGQALVTAGSAAAPAWGVVGIIGGGTNGTATPTAGAIAYGSGTAYAFTAAGTTGQVLTSNGSGTPTWTSPSSSITITDDTTTNAVRYPLYADATSGTISTEYVASTKYQFNPSTGVLSATGFSGSGASLTSLTAGNLSGTIPSAVLGNSTVYIGTTAVALNRASASISLTGTNIDGSAGSATTATTATNATNIAITDNTSSVSTYYPVISSATTGNVGATTSSTKLSFVPSTGVLSATSFTGAGTGLTGTAASLSIGGNSANVTGTVAIANGGTGQTTANAAFNALAPSQTSNSGKYLTTNGTNTSWASVSASSPQIQPISASVATNALTISASALSLDFRSTTLGSGTVTTVSGTPSNLVVPSTATLGTVSTIQSRLVVIALNNAGTIELAVVNISGGNNLDETTLLTTTAISASSTSASTVYSTTARTSVAFRVIGYIESTQTVAGTWLTAPSTIQGYGGQALASMSSLGYGQTWQTVTRTSGTTYYNTTGKPITLTSWSNGADAVTLAINGLTITRATSSSTNNPFTLIIPPGATYSLTGTYQAVVELR